MCELDNIIPIGNDLYVIQMWITPNPNADRILLKYTLNGIDTRSLCRLYQEDCPDLILQIMSNFNDMDEETLNYEIEHHKLTIIDATGFEFNEEDEDDIYSKAYSNIQPDTEDEDIYEKKYNNIQPETDDGYYSTNDIEDNKNNEEDEDIYDNETKEQILNRVYNRDEWIFEPLNEKIYPNEIDCMQNGDCWFRGNLDRLSELEGYYRLKGTDYRYCEVCYDNEHFRELERELSK